MYNTASNIEIGKYISLKIKEKYNGNASSFCKDILKIRNEDPTDKTSLALLKSRVNKIIKGTNGIQIDDLCYFTELFDITCEELLSAGEYRIVNTNRYTNYAFASSTDEEYWNKYLKRADLIFHNTDEYGKTVIDYMFEFKNYKLLKYLISKNVIWFVDEEAEYGLYFFAGTSIERKPTKTMASELQLELDKDKLRTDMISLSIDNHDYNLLDNLHAKEIPPLYMPDCVGRCMEIQDYYNEEMVRKIAESSDGNLISYFSKSFDIKNNDKSEEFIFPYIGRLADMMIKNKSHYTAFVLESVLRHNEKQFEKLSQVITEAYKSFRQENVYIDKNTAFDYITRYYFCFAENGVFSYKYSNRLRIASNVICISEQSKEPNINLLIDKINDYFYDIKSLNKSKLLTEEK